MSNDDDPLDAPWSEKEQKRATYLRKLADKFRDQSLLEAKFYHDETLAKTVRLIFWIENRCIRPLKKENGKLCHHKIIAATQCAIMYTAPFRDTKQEFSAKHFRGGWWNEKIRHLNAEFSLYATVDIMVHWLANEKNTVAIKYLLEDQKLAEIYRENLIWLQNLDLQIMQENAKNYRLRFPFLLVSQFWATVEQLSLK